MSASFTSSSAHCRRGPAALPPVRRVDPQGGSLRMKGPAPCRVASGGDAAVQQHGIINRRPAEDPRSRPVRNVAAERCDQRHAEDHRARLARNTASPHPPRPQRGTFEVTEFQPTGVNDRRCPGPSTARSATTERWRAAPHYQHGEPAASGPPPVARRGVLREVGGPRELDTLKEILRPRLTSGPIVRAARPGLAVSLRAPSCRRRRSCDDVPARHRRATMTRRRSMSRRAGDLN
jgi:hypothetical protein